MVTKVRDWQRPNSDQHQDIEQRVRDIITAVKEKHDAAIEEYSVRFDGFKPERIELQAPESYELAPELLTAIQEAAARIERFAKFQRESYEDRYFSDEFGTYGQLIVPIEAIAAYIPGGRFPLVSTALMTLIPAKIAGCERRVAVSPAKHPAILAAASIAGATDFIHLGGAQAIAALALGSKLCPAVDMIVGPGNAYVNQAKAQLQDRIKIDTLAGPSELLVLADTNAPSDWVVADLLAQSEHDPLALSVVCTWDESYALEIEEKLKNSDVGQTMLTQGNCEVVIAESVTEAIRFSDQFAPEHLSIMSEQIKPQDLRHYGGLFEGHFSAVAYGDYCAGPNHTLPTLGYARQKGGLYVGDFLKVLSYQKINEEGNRALAELATPLAQCEALILHEQSMLVRQK